MGGHRRAPKVFDFMTNLSTCQRAFPRVFFRYRRFRAFDCRSVRRFKDEHLLFLSAMLSTEHPPGHDPTPPPEPSDSPPFPSHGARAMMNQATGYAATALGFVAAAGGKPVLVKEIAEGTEIPNAYLAKIVNSLARKGILATQRG
ncbi:MAG: Rrf2 family transcriptional regulator, partial [Phycisphaerales bacterium]|nr:Rrf2 family transcriptional regulator [Phycisphaerales bacterium]